MGDRKDYGLLEVKEVETYVDAGWQIVDVVPVVPNQSGTGTIVTIHYLIRLSKA